MNSQMEVIVLYRQPQRPADHVQRCQIRLSQWGSQVTVTKMAAFYTAEEAQKPFDKASADTSMPLHVFVFNATSRSNGQAVADSYRAELMALGWEESAADSADSSTPAKPSTGKRQRTPSAAAAAVLAELAGAPSESQQSLGMESKEEQQRPRRVKARKVDVQEEQEDAPALLGSGKAEAILGFGSDGKRRVKASKDAEADSMSIPSKKKKDTTLRKRLRWEEDENEDEDEDDEENKSGVCEVYLECINDRSSKFYMLRLDGVTVHTQWGRIGTTGSTKAGPLATEAKAKQAYERTLREKERKGYVIVRSTDPAHPAADDVDAARAVANSTAKVAPKLLLANNWSKSVNPTGYWISEKLDGYRAFWDGQAFFSRGGNRFQAPDFFLAKMPQFPLDGELWLGRGMFQKCGSAVRRGGEAWRQLKYVVFDAPKNPRPFEDRLELLQKKLPTFEDLSEDHFVGVLSQTLCESHSHLTRELSRVEQLGGEGLMLRQPSSKYFAGRSNTLLKVKSFHDAEGIVTGYTSKALRVATSDGVEFNLGNGFSAGQLDFKKAFPIGTVVTYKYFELTDDKKPRFASFLRIREPE